MMRTDVETIPEASGQVDNCRKNAFETVVAFQAC